MTPDEGENGDGDKDGDMGTRMVAGVKTSSSSLSVVSSLLSLFSSSHLRRLCRLRLAVSPSSPSSSLPSGQGRESEGVDDERERAG